MMTEATMGDLKACDPRLNSVFSALQSIEHDLSLPLMLTIVAIAREPGLSINDLADRVGVPQQTASRYVSILQGRYQSASGSETKFARRPFVSWEVGSGDPRRRALFLTSSALAWLETLLSQIYKLETAL